MTRTAIDYTPQLENLHKATPNQLVVSHSIQFPPACSLTS